MEGKKPIAERLREATESQHPWISFAKASGFSVFANDGKIMKHIADEIEAELRESRYCAQKPLKFIKNCIKRGDDWPVPHEGESFKQYIERCYIQLPCDPEGKPWNVGDPVDYPADCNGDTYGEVYGYKFNGKWYLLIESVSGYYIQEFAVDCSRPTPKVHDADGVEIKVGDIVWFVNSGTERTVKSLRQHDDGGYEIEFTNNLYCTSPDQLTHERPVFDAEGERICEGDTVWDLDSGEKLLVVEFANRECGFIQCSKEDGDCEDHNAHNLTHREPDSLEKLRDDISARADELESTPYRGTQSISREWADRLTALIERGA